MVRQSVTSARPPRAGMGLCIALAAAFACLSLPAAELGQGPDPAVLRELRYAQALQELGMHDYAQIVLKRVDDPAADAILKVLKLQGLIALGKFDEVEAIIRQEPDQQSQEAWAMRLALADGYYAWGRYQEAQDIYGHFFAQYPNGPPEKLNEFYMNSAYKYAQMLILMGEREKAVAAYRNVLKADIEEGVERQVMGEMAELLVKQAESVEAAERKKYFVEVEKILNKILWKQDLWFGKAIVLMAHMRLMQDDLDGAQKLIDDYMGQLQELDRILKEDAERTGEDFTKLSPMAECRYLIGVIMQEEAEKILAEGGDRDKAGELLAGKELPGGKRTRGALHHFLTVFIKYYNTAWALQAGERAREVEDLLVREFNARIKKNVTDEQMERVRRVQFQTAHSLFNQNRFAEAAESLITVLNIFPEESASIGALGELARCYVETEEPMFRDMAIRHTAERFRAHPTLMSRAGDELLRLAVYFDERKMKDEEAQVYDLYFTHMPRHPRAPGILFRFGEERLAEDDKADALRYYRRIADDYPESPLAGDALSKAAFCYGELGDTTNQVKALVAYVDKLAAADKPGHPLIPARYRLAAAYKALGDRYVPAAWKQYNELIDLLTNSPGEYQKTEQEAEANRRVLEGSMFQKAVCYSLLKEPERMLEAYKRKSIEAFEALVAQFPESEFAPVALSQIGTLWTVLKKPDEAQRAFRRLQSEYANSEEAKNVLFMLGSNLLSLGMRREAVEVFEEMFAGSGKFSGRQFLTVGNAMMEAGERELALQGYDRALSVSEERGVREAALVGKGRLLVEAEKYAEGAELLDKLLEEFPSSGYTVEACFYLSRASATLASREPDADERLKLFNAAVKAMRRVRMFDTSQTGKARSDVEVARLSALKARAEEEFGSDDKAEQYRRDAVAAYQTLILLGDLTDPGVRRHVEQAFVECLPLLIELEMWQDTADDAEKYLEMFPQGRHAVEVRGFLNKARMKLVTQDAAAAAP